MAYGVLYEFAFESTNHADCLIQILKKNYTGEVIKRKLGRPPVLKRENKDRIYGTSCEIYAECVVDGEFSQLYTSSPYEFRVEVYRNNQLLWVGFVSPELYSEPDIAPPYDVQIIATDGLGELKDYTWNPLGLTTVQGILIELLGKSGLERSYYMASDLRYRNEYGSLSSPNEFLDIMLNLDHEEGETYYDVLQNLLSAFNFNISTYKDKWILFRETDFISDSADGRINIIDVNGYVVETEPGEFGSMRSCEYWPVGQLSVNIEPAKSSVELESPDHYKPNVLDFNSWSLKNKASYSDEENAYVLQVEGDMIDTGIYPEISQTINFDKNVAFLLGLKIKARKFGYVHSQDGIGVRIQMLGTVDGLASTYWLKKPDISSGSPSTDYVWSLNYSDFEESIKGTQGGYATSADVQDIDIVIPLHDDGDNFHAKTGQLTISIFNSSLYDSIYVYDVSLVKYEQIEGYKANVKIDNNAREENSDVNLSLTSGDRVPNYGEFFMTGIPIQPSGNGVIKLWNTHEGDKDYLSFMAQDWGQSIGLPKMRYSGVLNVPGHRYDLPVLFSRDNTYYFPKTYSFDLYNDELNVELISISAADVSLESVEISQIAQPSGQTGGNTTGGGTTGGGYVPIDKEMSDTSSNAVGNRVIKAYVDGTFATKLSLSSLDVRVTGLETYFSTSEDADKQINKWNEIVSFLNATEGTTLAGILATYATKDALAAVADSKITISGLTVGLGGEITKEALRTGLGLDTILGWYDTIGRFFKKDSDGNIYLDGDFYTNGQFAAKVAGTQGGSGGFAYLADLYDVQLSSLVSGDLLSWNGNEWINISRSALLAAYATKNELANALIPYIKESVADGRYTSKNELSTTLAGYATKGEIPSLEGYATEKFVTDKGYAKTSEVNETLKDYAKSADVDDTLKDYAKSSEVSNILEDYTTTADFTNELKSYAKTDDVNNTLKSYATNNSLNDVSDRVTTLEGAGYTTTKYVDDTFATKNALNGVSGRVTTLENAGFAIDSEVKEAIKGINTEIENTNTALTNGLNDRYTKKNVDNLFSNFKGTANITTLGTITSGVWNGSKIDNAYLANSKVTISGVDVSLGGSISQSALRTGLGLDALIAWYNSVGKAFGKNADGTYFVDGDFLTNGQFAAAQAGTAGGGGGVMLLTTWPTDSADYSGYALGGNLGVDLNTRVKTLEGKATSVSFTQTLTSGREIGAISVDGVTKKLYAPDVTESTVSGWGFTKNTGTYSKPSGGIPKSDLASAVQTSLEKADTALQSYTEQYTGTITGIKMNGVSKGTSGVVDLGNVITAHQDISEKVNRGELAPVAFSGEYGELNGIPSSLPASDVYAWAKAENKPPYSWSEINGTPSALSQFTNDLGLGSLAYRNDIDEELVENALGFSPFNAASFNKANIKSTLDISDWALLATKPSYKTSELTEETNLFFTDARAVAACAGTYLPLSGGVIDSVLAAPLEINSTSQSEVGVAYRMNGAYKGWIGYNPTYGALLFNYATGAYLGIRDNGKAYVNDSEIYHTGNFNPSDYLPLTGGTMSGRLKLAGAGTAWLTFEAPNGNTAYGSIGVANDHTAVFNDGISTKTLIHSGNIGSQSVAYAASASCLIGGTSNIDFTRGRNSVEMIVDASGSVGNFATGYQSGLSVITEYCGWQMTTYGGAEENPYFRSLQDNNVWKPWRKLAFLDDNVASATKLATPRTIWGQSFDGTGNVDGCLTLGGLSQLNRPQIKFAHSGDYFDLTGNFVLAPNSGSWSIFSESSSNTLFRVLKGGNVLIGTTADNGAKLQVNGKAVMVEETNLFQKYSTIRLTHYVTDGIGRIYTYDDNSGYCDTYIGRNNGDAIVVKANSNVLIGTTTDSGYKLDVYGTLRVTDTLTAQNGIVTNEITIGGIRIYVENGVLKVNGDLYTSGQFASGTIGN